MHISGGNMSVHCSARVTILPQFMDIHISGGNYYIETTLMVQSIIVNFNYVKVQIL